MFPGQGAQYVNMGADVYRHERVFREAVDQCAQILEPILRAGSRRTFYLLKVVTEESRERATTPDPLYAACAVHHRVCAGETVDGLGHQSRSDDRPQRRRVRGWLPCGCVLPGGSVDAGGRRAELVQAQAPGSMLAVRLPEPEIRPLLNGKLSIAAINSPNLCVVSGPHEAVAELEKQIAVERRSRQGTSHFACLPFRDDGASGGAIHRSCSERHA